MANDNKGKKGGKKGKKKVGKTKKHKSTYYIAVT